MAGLTEPPDDQAQSPPHTPPQPPFSPITPVMSHTALVPPPDSEGLLEGPSDSSFMSSRQGPEEQDSKQQSQPPVFAPEPSPVPISESQNPDAIALRSAISVLQMQRQRAMRDIRTLDELKQAAGRDPEGFARELEAGRIESEKGDIFNPGPLVEGEGEDNDGEEEEAGKEETGEDSMEVDDTPADAALPSRLAKIPAPQNVVRTPPVNWAKYHVVGEALDQLHEEQRRRPTSGEHRRDAPTAGSPPRNAEHVIAAPYRPFTDKLERRAGPKGANKPKHEQT